MVELIIMFVSSVVSSLAAIFNNRKIMQAKWDQTNKQMEDWFAANQHAEDEAGKQIVDEYRQRLQFEVSEREKNAALMAFITIVIVLTVVIIVKILIGKKK